MDWLIELVIHGLITTIVLFAIDTNIHPIPTNSDTIILWFVVFIPQVYITHFIQSEIGQAK